MRLLALEWDDTELRAVAARTVAGKLTLERLWALPLAGSDSTSVQQKLAEVIRDLGTNRIETLIAVGRANLELRVLTIPAAPPDEVPDLVRFQAMRQFSTLGEDWAVDFVHLADRGEEGLTVLAAALSPDSIASLRGPCEAVGLSVKCLGLRPFAATAVVREQQGPDFGCRMLVDILTGEADLTVIAGGLAVLPRTIRLPKEQEEETLRQVIKGEIRRTMIAASNQLGGRRVDEVIIFGEKQELVTPAAKLSTELGIPVITIDPFDAMATDANFTRPTRPGRFAPLLGLLIDHAADCPPQIDFLNPHRRPEPKDNRRIYSLAALTAIVVLLLPVIGIYWALSAKTTEIEELTLEKNKLDREIKGYQTDLASVEELKAFEAGNIRWLDELAWLSERLPPADKTIVNELSAIALSKDGGGGILTVQAAADTTSTVAGMEPSLSDPRHVVRGSGTKQDENLEKLRWRFSKTITIAPHGEDEPAQEEVVAPVSAQAPAAAKGDDA